MSLTMVPVVCPLCERGMELEIDLARLARMRIKASCAHCQGPFDVITALRLAKSRASRGGAGAPEAEPTQAAAVVASAPEVTTGARRASTRPTSLEPGRQVTGEQRRPATPPEPEPERPVPEIHIDEPRGRPSWLELASPSLEGLATRDTAGVTALTELLRGRNASPSPKKPA